MLGGQLCGPLAETVDWTGAEVISGLSKEASMVNRGNTASVDNGTILLLCLIFPAPLQILLWKSVPVLSERWDYQSQEWAHTACSWDLDLGSDFLVYVLHDSG